MLVGIIDYGAGNIASVRNALDRLGVRSIASGNPADFEAVDKIIFPGVGHAREAIANLRRFQLDLLIKTTRKPLLGICLGMQLLGSYSEEGDTECLKLFDFRVMRFRVGLKIPHMGWNRIKPTANTLLNGINDGEWLYFVHSYCVPVTASSIASANYGVEFSVAVNRANYWGVQFHPEKSGEKGLLILKNFIELCK
jgi:glutamine amidotransferase